MFQIVVDYNASNIDVVAKKLQIAKHGCFKQLSSTDTITTVLRWAPKISATNSVSSQMRQMVTISGSVLDLLC